MPVRAMVRVNPRANPVDEALAPSHKPVCSIERRISPPRTIWVRLFKPRPNLFSGPAQPEKAATAATAKSKRVMRIDWINCCRERNHLWHGVKKKGLPQWRFPGQYDPVRSMSTVTLPPPSGSARAERVPSPAATGSLPPSRPKRKRQLWRLVGDVLQHGGPGYLQFAITNICNAKCDFCGFAVDRR